MDIFKNLGINVGGDQSLINQTQESESVAKGEFGTDIVRKGAGTSARDMLEAQLNKGMVFEVKRASPHAEPAGERVENPSLKDTHGEMFHSDNDKQAQELQSKVEEVDQSFDGEDKDPKRQPKKRTAWDYPQPGHGEGETRIELKMKSEREQQSLLFLKAMADRACGIKKDAMPPPPPPPQTGTINSQIGFPFGKGTRNRAPSVKPSMHAPRQKKDPAQAKMERQVRREMGVGKSDSLIEMVEDPFSPLTIRRVHENSPGVAERRRPSVFPELQRSMAFDKMKSKDAVSSKISKLVREGKPQKQAVATALNMEREGRLTPGGGYKRVGKSEIDEMFDIIKGEKMISTPKKEMIDEHKKLVDVLESPSHKDDKKEAKKQKQELKDYQKAEKFDYNHDGKLDQHEKDHKKNAKLIQQLNAKKSFIKSAGVGGIVFDFGPLTGNPIADNATALLNQHADPVQASNVAYQRDSYNQALMEYTKKGEAYHGEKTPFGNVEKGWADQLNKPMDQQVKEAFEAGALDKGGPAIKNQYNETQMSLNGEVIKATSETDAAVIEMMKASGMDLSGLETGTIADATSGGKIKVTAGE